ncbi:hypothetical protein [Dictyobacter aurantiacus]|uniref:Uncharacterized protein n=1 Tax=Dictyobacter aurantiacus TaxID=1936993 RepID=A0A401ZC15_9CHLR|nr:hypothetical protein [Dictyobacter aurantiacus]GCE04366.1 hypothetical protein KDAU_16950 [Dictyobacter aurantiacus]
MLQYALPIQVDTIDLLTVNKVVKGRLDLMVLRHMACQLQLALLTTSQQVDMTKSPMVYELTERQSCLHRIVFYRSQVLHEQETLSFVGFVSGRQTGSDDILNEELSQADRHMLAKLTHIPGLLAYSSMELRPGRWYNLVMMQTLDVKANLKGIDMHQHAAYHLAPRAYDWIRIHSGIFPGGLAKNAPQLLKSKHYAFHHQTNNFQMHEIMY